MMANVLCYLDTTSLYFLGTLNGIQNNLIKPADEMV